MRKRWIAVSAWRIRASLPPFADTPEVGAPRLSRRQAPCEGTTRPSDEVGPPRIRRSPPACDTRVVEQTTAGYVGEIYAIVDKRLHEQQQVGSTQ